MKSNAINYIKISKKDFYYVEEAKINNNELKKFFLFYPDYGVFVKSPDEEIIGIIFLSEFKKKIIMENIV